MPRDILSINKGLGGLNLKLGLVGISHEKTPIEIREKFSFSESQKIEASYILMKDLEEVLILSTCNRSEIYYVCQDHVDGARLILDFYRDFFSYPLEEKYIFHYESIEAVRHLYMVSGGLNSVVIGEDQILGQVKDAMEFSMNLKFSGKFLNRLFQSALAVGKSIRSEFSISSIPLSSSYIGIKLVSRDLDGLKGKKALVVGAGQMGELAIKYMYDQDMEEIFVANRSDGTLDRLFETYPDLTRVEYDQRYDVLDQVDLLISATAASHRVIRDKDFAQRTKDLVILDLGLPRDVEEAIGQRDRVKIYTLDDLGDISEKNKAKRKKLAQEAMAYIEKDTEDFIHWLEETNVDPILCSLNCKIDEIKEDASSYLNRKLDLSAREKRITEEVLAYALGRITREAVLCIKEKSDEPTYHQAMKELFDLEV